MRPAVEHLVTPRGARGELQAGGPLRTEPPATHRGRRVALDLDDALVLDEDLLRAPDRAVRADRLHDPVGVLGFGRSARVASDIAAAPRPLGSPLLDCRKAGHLPRNVVKATSWTSNDVHALPVPAPFTRGFDRWLRPSVDHVYVVNPPEDRPATLLSGGSAY